MEKLTEEKKIKIGLICNKICTVLFVLFFIDTCVVFNFVGLAAYLISVTIIVLLFSICTIIAHKFLKDYKPQ